MTTLNQALITLGELMATNLTKKGVDASASDGLTTLANKILDVSSQNIITPYYSNPCDDSSRLSEINTAANGVDVLSYDSTEEAYTVTPTTTSNTLFSIPVLTDFMDWSKYNRLIISVEVKNSNNNVNARAGFYINTNQWYAVEKEDPVVNTTGVYVAYNGAYSLRATTRQGSAYNSDGDWIRIEATLDLYDRHLNDGMSEDNYKLTGTVNIINTSGAIVSTFNIETQPFNITTNNNETSIGLVAKNNTSAATQTKNQVWFRNLIVKKANV